MSQLSFATLDHRNKKKQTKRERFLAEMDAVVPWAALLGLIEPHYPKAGNGRGHIRWLSCCGSTSCSSGISCPIRAPKRRSTTSSRCAHSPG